MSPFTIKPGVSELPAGEHAVVITKAKAGKSSNGNPELRVEFEDASGAFGTDWLYPTDRAMWRVEQLWTAAGLEWPYAGGEIDEADLVDRRARVVLIEEKFEDKTRTKVDGWLPPETGDASDAFKEEGGDPFR
jgi:hypothetical protein